MADVSDMPGPPSKTPEDPAAASMVDKFGIAGKSWKELEKMLTREVSAMNCDIEKVCALLDAGTGVEVKDSTGCTVLLCAAHSGNAAACALLLDRGADIEANAFGGETALLFAARYGRADVCELLMKRGADVEVKNEDGEDAPFLAESRGHDAIAALIRAERERRAEKKKEEDFIKATAAFRTGVAVGPIEPLKLKKGRPRP